MNEIRLAIIGAGDKGNQHISLFKQIEGVKVVALCDPDRQSSKTAPGVTSMEKWPPTLMSARCSTATTSTPSASPRRTTGMRSAAVWACQAGKDVYVEKPVSHNVWEGRQIVKAARKHGRIVQTGTQSRSAPGTREFIADLHAGNYGKVKLARGLCYKRRESIGKVTGPQPVPGHIDYNLWSGPRETRPGDAPAVPLRLALAVALRQRRPRQPGDPPDGPVPLGARVRPRLAPRVVSLGGRFGYDDDGQTPNTQVVILDYEAAPLVFEVRGLPDAAGQLNRMSHYRGGRVAMVIECEAGYFVGTDGGIFFDHDGKKVKGYSSGDGAPAPPELHRRPAQPEIRRPPRRHPRGPPLQRPLPPGQHLPSARHGHLARATRRPVQRRGPQGPGLRAPPRARPGP